ncbi:MAG: hypothetical protein PHZ19_08520 [Candidatus Thermoplasmatota archaeon]|nr:hypothetical protein [Candidatus Thermoplasmatota archaeon]
MLATLEDFRASPYNKQEYSDGVILSALKYAEARFYEFTNRGKFGYWLEPRQVSMVLDGTGARLLRTTYPVLKVIECTIIDSPDGTARDVTNEVRIRRHFIWRREGFREGFANVRLVALCGDPAYAVLPEEDSESAESGEAEPTIPPDVTECVLRIADLKLRRKRVAGEEVSERRPSANPQPPPPTITGDR